MVLAKTAEKDFAGRMGVYVDKTGHQAQICAVDHVVAVSDVRRPDEYDGVSFKDEITALQICVGVVIGVPSDNPVDIFEICDGLSVVI